ncbi:MAG: hypothetical protein U9N63_03495, partial [Pseudomonadota bacterium]|nr:hypothetical protein [Pseudomonadota bacterium]
GGVRVAEKVEVVLNGNLNGRIGKRRRKRREMTPKLRKRVQKNLRKKSVMKPHPEILGARKVPEMQVPGGAEVRGAVSLGIKEERVMRKDKRKMRTKK